MHPVIKTKKINFFLLVSNEIEADVGTKPHSLLKLLMSQTSCKAQILDP